MVGFPRSGTTLAQSIVMCDDRVFSIPETHLFTKGISSNRLPEFVSNLWTTWYCYRWIKRYFNERKFIYNVAMPLLIEGFFKYIADKAKDDNKSIILEKTPAHLNEIQLISSIFPDAQFIHVIRSYKGAIPSILKAAGKWQGNTSPLQAMRRWVAEVFTSEFYSDKYDNHVLFEYDEVVKDRDCVVTKINEQLSLNILDTSDVRLALFSKSIVDSRENWKKNNLNGFRNVKECSELNGSAFKKFAEYLSSIVDK